MKQDNMENKFQPNNLDEAVDHILSFINNDQAIEFFESYSEDEDGFGAQLHFFYGRNIRNEWFLWWYKDHKYENWPKEMPAIVKHFNDMEIYHADDMSGIILSCVWRKYYNKPRDLEEQIKFYHNHWLKYTGNINPMLKNK